MPTRKDGKLPLDEDAEDVVDGALDVVTLDDVGSGVGVSLELVTLEEVGVSLAASVVVLASVVSTLEDVVGAASTAAGTAVVVGATETEEDELAAAGVDEAAALLDLTRQREPSDLRLSFFGLTTWASTGAATGAGSGAALRAARAWWLCRLRPT